jgi:hypothetical protein
MSRDLNLPWMLCQVIGLPEAANWKELPSTCPPECQTDPKKAEAFEFLVKWVEEHRRPPQRKKHLGLGGQPSHVLREPNSKTQMSGSVQSATHTPHGIAPPAHDQWLFTEDEAAFLLNMTTPMLATRRRAGKIGAIKDGKFIRYKEEHLIAYIQDHHRNVATSTIATSDIDPTTLLAALKKQLLASSPRKRSSKDNG